MTTATQLSLPLTPATDPGQSFQHLLKPRELVRLYRDRVRRSRGRGVDRTDTRSFERRLREHVRVVSRKASDASYGYAPYAELLRLKGRGKAPRVVSIPTLRDRLLLQALKEVLHDAFPDAVHRQLPNAHIRAIKAELAAVSDLSKCTVLKRDISNFYGDIDHAILRERLDPVLGGTPVLPLVMKAVANPTVVPGSRRGGDSRKRTTVGVPQGLTISNVLANLYALPLDGEVKKLSVLYERYVDDILVVVKTPNTSAASRAIDEGLRSLRLTLNHEKSVTKPATEPFDFLGYRFQWPVVSARPSSVDRFITSIAARVTSFVRGEREFLAQHPWLTKADYDSILVEDLNERITGALSENKRYGWLFYFLEMNDMGLLRQMDRSIESILQRVPAFGRSRPPKLKTLSRAFYEAKYSPRSGYIMSYDAIADVPGRIAFLRRHGHLSGALSSVQEVNRLFEKVRARRLSRLEADVGNQS